MNDFSALLTDALQYTASTHSPCIGICDHNPTQACSGCQRQHSDVENWRALDAKTRQALWQKIPKKLADQKAQFLRLPLDQQAILRLAKARLDTGGTWVLGGGILGGLSATKSTGDCADGTTATNSDGSIKLRLHKNINMRALLWASPTQRLDDAPSTLPILLVVARARLERGEGAHQKPLSKNYRTIPQPNDTIRISSVLDTSASHQRIDSALATAITTTAPLPDAPTNDVALPASYALGLTLLP